MSRRAATIVLGLAMVGWVAGVQTTAAAQKEKTVTLQVTGMM